MLETKKMNEFKNLKSEINIEKSIESLNILKDIFSFLPKKRKINNYKILENE